MDILEDLKFRADVSDSFDETGAESGEEKASAIYIRAIGEIRSLRSERDALQAKVDALMLEYCPDDMTPKQLERWGAAQKPAVV